ncbi:hypothetical protein GF351_03860 [Candidatus Woesearchaeota archaeon]|nr:hypothetical protein [Candidatus Woesearchaeota archaeon]
MNKLIFVIAVLLLAAGCSGDTSDEGGDVKNCDDYESKLLAIDCYEEKAAEEKNVRLCDNVAELGTSTDYFNCIENAAEAKRDTTVCRHFKGATYIQLEDEEKAEQSYIHCISQVAYELEEPSLCDELNNADFGLAYPGDPAENLMEELESCKERAG